MGLHLFKLELEMMGINTYNRDDLVLDETKKAALENSLAGLKRVKERLEGQALGLMGDNILDN